VSTKSLFLIFTDIAILAVLIKLIFRNFKNLLKGILHFIYPTLLLFSKQQYDTNADYSNKFIFIMIILVIISIVELELFY
jgi:hypothetical protein